jgi:membrane-associated phospholipid phosphatase
VNILAKALSYLFHPLLMPSGLFAMLAALFPPALYPIKMETQLYFVLFVSVITLLLPLVNLVFFRQFGVIRSFTLINREERIKPFLFIALLYLAGMLMFYYKTRIGWGDNVFKLLVIINALVVVAFLITLMYKASIHSLAICGVLGILLPLAKAAEDGSLFIPLLVTLVLAGMIMSARLQLNAHTPRQVLVGAVAGFATAFTGMIILF